LSRAQAKETSWWSPFGRLHRLNEAKKEVIIYDYVDVNVPVLAKMHARRRTGYKAIGYEISSPDDKAEQLPLQNL
jgi:hypothetical protein